MKPCFPRAEVLKIGGARPVDSGASLLKPEQPEEEVASMALGPKNTEKNEPAQDANWQRIDEVADRLLSKCAAALHANLPEAAETYHAMWVEEATRIWLAESE